ncbi:LuxR C-terminal-related transcriptional regulator [Pseudofrankia sp. DC12]|uniref:LuxR C-terminal-related transcriptional regulator n=1 Tax=Pseudofrankia sp. DC12 TaxID=683315 RepID=UPI0005F8734F|nr:LuxR C-terminal-related transcriptional regulator [Pseudofrankia sp. DC12]
MTNLDFLGLTPFGQQVYEQVALHPYADTDGIAGFLGADVAAVAAELRDQANRGQIRSVGGAWLAEDLTQWLDTEHARQQAEQATAAAERARQRSRLLRSRLPAAHRQGTRKLVGNDGTELVTHGEVSIRIAELAEQSTDTLRFMLNGNAGFGPNPHVIRAFVSAAKRGVRLTSVWTPECIAAARGAPNGRLPPLGQVHASRDVPYRAVVADGRAVLVQREPDDPSLGALVITHHPTVALYAHLIDALFRAGQPLSPNVPPPPAEHTFDPQRESQILHLIATGATNDLIGKNLGVSTRTVQREVSRLMERYQARNRIELISLTTDLPADQLGDAVGNGS